MKTTQSSGWKIIERSDGSFEIQDENCVMVADDGSASGEYNQTMTQATAARIVACVNACDGIPTHQLFEEEGAPNNLGAVIDTLRTERDALLAALRQTRQWIAGEASSIETSQAQLAMIDNATGEQQASEALTLAAPMTPNRAQAILRAREAKASGVVG